MFNITNSSMMTDKSQSLIDKLGGHNPALWMSSAGQPHECMIFTH